MEKMCYDQPIDDLIKQFDEVRKVSTGQADDSTTGCLLDYAYFKDIYRLIAVEYSKVNVKLSDSQLNKLKTTVKDQTGVTLQMNIKTFNGNNLPHELLLTTRQKTKFRNAFRNSISADIKLSKAQISKIIQSGGFLTNY